MYENRICTSNKVFDCQPVGGDTSTNQAAMDTAWGFFVKTNVLGDKHQIPRLRNHAIDAILHIRKEWNLNLGIIPYVYRQTTDDHSPLRCLMVRIAKWESEDIDIANSKHGCAQSSGSP
jgi:hypothetical protein